nr:hypothetical protein [Tanacetum cinerariifolium]
MQAEPGNGMELMVQYWRNSKRKMIRGINVKGKGSSDEVKLGAKTDSDMNNEDAHDDMKLPKETVDLKKINLVQMLIGLLY